MPRIDPLALLNCLSVLLGPSGGIKGTKEVDRLATLMTKFSKKLVSKCIYIQILKTTSTDLLNQFMSTGGWDLIHVWLTDAILAKNWALIQELLELLLLCPVDIARLKSNNNPKLIKGLSKEGSHQGVRILACRLVEQWLKIVKDSVPPPVDPLHPLVPVQSLPQPQHLDLKIEPEAPKVQSEIPETVSTVKVQDLEVTPATTNSHSPIIDQQQPQYTDKISIQPVQLQIVNKTLPGQTQPTQIKKQSFVVVSNSSQHQPSVPVYKITIRDGKQVLTKVETDAANIQNVKDSPKNVDNTDTVDDKDVVMRSECDNGVVETREDTKDLPGEVANMSISFKEDNVDVKDVKDCSDSKSNDKENRDEEKKEEKAGVEKKREHSSKGSSKHSSSSRSSHKSSHRSSSSGSRSSSSSSKSRDKDRHHSRGHSSSSKGKSEREREREKEKEKMKKDQAEKDKATLEKVQGQSLSTKFGKIPKKKSEEERSDGSVRKSSTDSRDSSKENKDKTDPKKSPVHGVLEKKNISISIENRKNSLDTSRPKTVKTFNSKFRSTGLEEEVKPPPPRNSGKKVASSSGNDKKVVLPAKVPLKRSSPLRETAVSDKRAKLSIDTTVPIIGEDKKGAIKLIPAKPKPMVLQESDMFMDALTASTKSKEPRKRKRRSSLSKDDKADGKKTDGNSLDNKEGTPPPPASPPAADERSPISIKPDFKFYQDTLETDEDKEPQEKASPDSDKEEEAKENVAAHLSDDEGSRTPTNEEEVEDPKGPASPDDSDEPQREPSSPNSEIRYVDGLRSVLLLQKRKGPKKSLKWKEELESVRYFELDETERVNVTKTFTDMKQMEKMGEREAFQMARKLNNEDVMEEKTRWSLLIPIDLPPPLVEPGKESKEKDIQYAREKGILQALYFNRGMIPDSPAEPDEERHHIVVDPKVIPLDDLTGNKESEKDFTMVPWPEPKPSLVPSTPPVVPSVYHQAFPHNQGMGMAQGMPGPMGLPMGQNVPPGMMPMNHIVPEVGAGGWRTGDGKVVVPDVNMPGMNNMTNMTGFPPPNMMPPPGMFNHQGHHPGHQAPEGGFPPMMMEEGNFVGHMQGNFQGPPAMFGPGPNFQGPPPRPGMRGRGGPGWFRGGMGPMRGGWPVRGNWRGGKQPPVCRQFSKNGFCRVGDKCQYLHPGVNCPPF